MVKHLKLLQTHKLGVDGKECVTEMAGKKRDEGKGEQMLGKNP